MAALEGAAAELTKYLKEHFGGPGEGWEGAVGDHVAVGNCDYETQNGDMNH